MDGQGEDLEDRVGWTRWSRWFGWEGYASSRLRKRNYDGCELSTKDDVRRRVDGSVPTTTNVEVGCWAPRGRPSINLYHVRKLVPKLCLGRPSINLHHARKHVPPDGKEISSRVQWLTRPRPKLRSRIDFVTNSGGYNYK